MQHITPKSLQQYKFVSLEDCIEQNNALRIIDAFVEKMGLNKSGFKLNSSYSKIHFQNLHYNGYI